MNETQLILSGMTAALIGVSLQSVNPFEPRILEPQYWCLVALGLWSGYVGIICLMKIKTELQKVKP